MPRLNEKNKLLYLHLLDEGLINIRSYTFCFLPGNTYIHSMTLSVQQPARHSTVFTLCSSLNTIGSLRLRKVARLAERLTRDQLVFFGKGRVTVTAKDCVAAISRETTLTKAMAPTKITGCIIKDLRFPTSLEKDGSDAVV